MTTKRWTGISLLVLLGAWAMSALAGPTRPLVESIHTLPELQSLSGSWVAHARDSIVTSSWGLVKKHAFTRMAAVDSIRIFSSSTADSTWTMIVGVASDTSKVMIRARITGTDTTYIYRRMSHLEAWFADTTHAGTLSIRAKTGTADITTIPAGELQTYAAHHFQGQSEGRLRQVVVHADPESPAVHVQVRLYRHPPRAISNPEVGYSVLDEFFTNGEYTYRPNIAEAVITAAKDTSVTFSIVGAERVGYFNSTRSVGTAVTAFYMDVSPDRSSWRMTNGVDSVTGASSTKIRARVINPDSLYAMPWARFIVNMQGNAGDSAIVSSFITIRRTGLRDPIIRELDEQIPAQSYVAAFARSMGSHGTVSVTLKGEDSKLIIAR